MDDKQPIGRSWRVAAFAAIGVVLALLFALREHRAGSRERSSSNSPVSSDIAPERSAEAKSKRGLGIRLRNLPNFQVADPSDADRPALHPGRNAVEVAMSEDITPSEAFERESRRVPWAEQMEAKLQGRYSTEELEKAGISTLVVDKLECRSSACRVDYTFGAIDLEIAAKAGFADPVELMTGTRGPIATAEYRERLSIGETIVPGTLFVRKTESGSYATSSIVIFSNKHIDPEQYDDVAAALAKQHLAAVEEWRISKAGGGEKKK